MHIIVLENEPSSFRGGLELSLLDICNGLFQRGHLITLLYVKEGNLLKEYAEFCQHIINVNDYRINPSTPIRSLRHFLTDVWKIPKLDKSIVYSHHYHDSLFGRTLALSKNIPFVCHLHLPPPKTIGYQWNVGLKGVSKFIAVSNQTKLDWVKRDFKAKRIEVVYNGINSELFEPSKDFLQVRQEWNIPEDIRVISYIGRLDREKGLETLIKAFSLLLKKTTNLHLLIAGKPVLQNQKYQASLEELATELGIENRTVFLGHITNTISLYQVSDVTVLPSLHSEPFGRVIVESMSCGTPVVASRTGGIPEILTGEFQGSLFEAGNEQDLSNTLERIMNWRDNDPQLGERCREHILQKFSLETMMDGIEKTLWNVVLT